MMMSLVCILWICSLFCYQVLGADNSLQLKIINLSGRPIEVYWINTFQPEHELVRQTTKPLRNNSDHSVNTFATHSFNFRFAHHVEGVDANYTMGPSDVKVRVVYDEIKQEMHLDIIDAATEMKALVQSATQECHKQHLDDKDGLKACLVDNLMNEVNRVGDSIDRLENYRSKMSNRIRNYICEDDDVVSSEPLKSFDYYHLDGSYMVDMYLDTENAKIWTIDNFITEEECDLLVESTKDRLQPAGTVGADGLEEISSTRKAQQASYEFNKSNIRSDKLWPLYDRIIRNINFYGMLNLQPDGQEGLSVIQYGSGDEYLSHCDGNCDGSHFRKASRVATGIVYCRVAERGGATVFPKANVVIKPREGMATFFTYKGRNNKYDFKSTEHSGCPVIEGEKWIATAWLREGVNDKLTHLHVDPSGFAIESEPLDETPQVRTTKAVQMEEDTEINLEEKSHDEL